MPKVGESVPLSSLSSVKVGQSVPLSQLGAEKSAAAPTPAPQHEGDILDHITSFTNSIFPGKQIGNALGENLYGLWQLVHGNYQGFKDAADRVGNNFGPIAGDTANAVITPASMLVGGPAGTGVKAVAGRIATNAAIGAGLGGASAASGGQDITKGAAAGAALGTAGSATGEVLNTLLSKLPVRLVRGVLPKLKPGNEQSVLQNTKLGSVSSMLNGAQSAVDDHSSQIKNILSNERYAAHTGAGNAAVEQTLGAFPNSEYDAPTIVQSVKDLVPEQSKLVSKIQQGTATLAEKNTVRQALDAATKKRFTDAPQLTASKQIGAKFADALRHEVQTHAPETQPIFQTLAKEIDVRNALGAAQKKLDKQANIGLLDILSYMTAGVPALLGEKAARSPAVSIGTAKGLNKAAKALPVINAAARALRGPVIKAATSGQ